MTTLRALTRAVRKAPWDRNLKRALIDALQDLGVDVTTAAVLTASVSRAAHLRQILSVWRPLRPRSRYTAMTRFHSESGRTLNGPIVNLRGDRRDDP